MKLYRFAYSPYARKIQMVLQLLGHKHQVIDVPYIGRGSYAEKTGGYMMVPALELSSGKVITDSRKICEFLVTGKAAKQLTPSPFEGPIWAYADWCDGPLEDVLFRIASPLVRARFFKTAEERGLYTFIKERKFGTGCVEQWAKDSPKLTAKAKHLLKPTLTTLSKSPFLFGQQPTLADAALYGQFAMLQIADAKLPVKFGAIIPKWLAAVEAVAR